MLTGEVPTFYTIQHAHNPRQRNRARLFSIWRRRWCPLVRQWVLSEVCKFTMWFIISSTPTGLDISFPRLILSTQLGKPSLQFLPNDEPTMCDINILEDAISIVEGNYPWPGLHFHFDRFLQRSLITSRCVFVFRPQESLIPILQLRTGPGSGFHLQRGAACWCGHDWTREKGSSTSPLLWEKWLVYTWAAKLTNHVLRFSSVKRRYTEKHQKNQTWLFQVASNSHGHRGVGTFHFDQGIGVLKTFKSQQHRITGFLRKNYVKITPFYGLFTQIYGLFTGYGFFTGQIIPKTWFWATLPDPSNCRCTLPRCNWLEFSPHG